MSRECWNGVCRGGTSSLGQGHQQPTVRPTASSMTALSPGLSELSKRRGGKARHVQAKEGETLTDPFPWPLGGRHEMAPKQEPAVVSFLLWRDRITFQSSLFPPSHSKRKVQNAKVRQIQSRLVGDSGLGG